MVIQTDRYTKFILTVIALGLILVVFKPQIQRILTPPSAHALTRLEGVVDEKGSMIYLTDVLIRNNEGTPVPTKQIQPVQVYWTEPMPVIVMEEKKK